jgi:hypothetical protein
MCSKKQKKEKKQKKKEEQRKNKTMQYQFTIKHMILAIA